MNTIKIIRQGLFLGLLVNFNTALAQDVTVAPSLIPATEPASLEIAPSHGVIDASKGCLAGAVLGMVLPGLGNLIGCAAGGLAVWWLRYTPTTPTKPSA